MSSKPKAATLWSHQNVSAEHFVAEMQAGASWIPLVMPTAAGKTVSIQVALKLLLQRGQIQGAVILTPQEHIEDTFLTEGRWLCVNHSTEREIVDLTSSDLLRLRDFDSDDVFSDLSKVAGKIIVTTHAKGVRMFKDKVFPAADMTGWVVVTDEGHHNGQLATVLDEVNAKVIRQKGRVWTVTASPFRSDNRRIYPSEAVSPLTFGYASIASRGVLPKNISFMTLELKRVDRPRGEHLSSDIETITEFVAASKRPTVIRIQRSSILDDEDESKAKVTAMRYVEALVRHGVPRDAILQAVGDEDSVKAEVKRRLGEEREIARGKGYGHQKLQVAISCQRFGEGADWPFCSQIVSVGIPTTLNGFVQLLGRGARSKKGIKNYPKEWLEEVMFVAFTPTLDLNSENDFSKARALLLAAAVECNDVVCDFLQFWNGFVDNFRLPPEVRDRPGFWEQITGLDPEQEAKSKLVGVEACSALRTYFGRDPTLKEVVSKLKLWGMKTQEVKQVIQSLIAKNPEIRSAAKSAICNAAEAAVKRAAARGDGPGSVDHNDVKRAFDEELLTALLRVAESFPDLAVAMDSEILGKFKGITSASHGVLTHKNLPVLIAAIVAERDQVYDVSDAEVMERVIQPFLQWHGTLPNPERRGGTEVVTAEARLNLRQIDASLRRRKRLDLYRLSVCDPMWISGPDIAWDEVLKKIPMNRRRVPTEWWKDMRSIYEKRMDPKYFVTINGQKENLIGLELARRFGWRGSPGGKSLAE